MKKMKKVLSFALILLLLMGNFSMVFGTDTTKDSPAKLSDITVLLGEKQITVCQNLGIIEGMPDGTFQPAQLVNRAQFAAVITRALGIPESALAGYSTTGFQDTSGYGWAVPYLAFCQSKGIMIGDGYGNAMPGRTITVNEAMTMILRAIGYVDNSSELVGKWPANFVTKAKSVGLYDGIANEAYMDRENAAIAIYNALTVAMVSVNADGKTETILTKDIYTTETGETAFWPLYLITAGLGCIPEKGVITDFDFGRSLISIADILGAYGTKFIYQKTEEIVAFSMESIFITGYVDGKKFYVADEEKSYAFEKSAIIWPISNNVTDGAVLFHNGGRAGWGAISDAAIDAPSELIDEFVYWGDKDKNGAAKTASDGEEVTLAVKLAGLTIKKAYSMASWTADVMAVISADELTAIDDKELLDIDFVLNGKQEIDYKQFQLIGVDNLANIEAGNVVYIYADKFAGKDSVIRRVAVGRETIEGTIDRAQKDSFTIGDEKYRYASEYLFNRSAGLAGGGLTDGPDEVTDAAGDDAVVKLDAYGYAYSVDITEEMGLFGVVLEAASTLMGTAAEMLALTADDLEKNFKTLKLSSVDYYEARNEYGEKKVKSKGGYPGDIEPGTLIGYQLNTDGVITAVEGATEETDIIVRSKTVLEYEGTRFLISPDCVVFGHDDGDWYVSKLSEIDLTAFLDDDKQPVAIAGQMILDARGHKVIALLLDEKGFNSDADTVYGVVNSYTNAGKEQSLTGLFDGSAKRLRTIERADLKVDDAPKYFNESYLYELGFWQLKLNANEKVTRMWNLLGEDIDEEEQALRHCLEYGGKPWGVIERTSGDQIKMSANGTEDAEGDELDYLSMEGDVIVYKAELKGGRVHYIKSSLLNIPGVNKDGECKAVAWGFDTKKEKDITRVANVVLWMSVDDFEVL